MRSNWFPVLLGIIIVGVVIYQLMEASKLSAEKNKDFAQYVAEETKDSEWIAPSLYSDVETSDEERKRVMYGEDLIAHTSRYFGPDGSISQTTNGMNCQNCHLDAGKHPWGNNFGAVYANYPQFRSRSNKVESINARVEDCFERSLDGHPLDSTSKEMEAIYTYIKWLGQNVTKGKKPYGAGLSKLPLLARAADPVKGKIVYMSSCQSCHSDNGQGVLAPNGKEYVYPPLWGEHSYNDGAGLFRISNAAAFIKNNMPFNVSSHANPTLTDEQAWDVAAFINSQPRPHLMQTKDYPDLHKKPFDDPFGPYADHYSAQQHKYGPYQEIINVYGKQQSK